MASWMVMEQRDQNMLQKEKDPTPWDVMPVSML
jgi:hypothetical protein